MGKWIHKLSNCNIELRTAVCASCGVVEIRNHTNCWHCIHALKEQKSGIKNIDWNKPSVCVICNLNKQLVIDHDHRTHNFRGWVCTSCNNILGHCDADPNLPKKLAEYILRH